MATTRPAATRSATLVASPAEPSSARRAGDTLRGDDSRRRRDRVVRPERARPAVAAARGRAVGGAGQRGHAAADAGGPGAAGVRGVAGALARPGGPGGGPAGRGGPDVGQARLPAARAAVARGR